MEKRMIWPLNFQSLHATPLFPSLREPFCVFNDNCVRRDEPRNNIIIQPDFCQKRLIQLDYYHQHQPSSITRDIKHHLASLFLFPLLARTSQKPRLLHLLGAEKRGRREGISGRMRISHGSSMGDAMRCDGASGGVVDGFPAL